jgi:hypothetical protein
LDFIAGRTLRLRNVVSVAVVAVVVLVVVVSGIAVVWLATR